MRLSLFIKNISVGCVALTVAGCSLFSPVNNKPPTKYVLSSAPAPSHHRTRPVVLMVHIPVTRPVYDTTQIAYTTKPYQVAYLSKNQWAETPAQMLQPLLVESLQNMHAFRAVVIPPFVGYYDYTLDTQILQLQEDFTHIPATFKLTLRVQLNRVSTNEVLGTKQIFICQPLRGIKPYCAVLAANLAIQKALKQIDAFCLQKIGRA